MKRKLIIFIFFMFLIFMTGCKSEEVSTESIGIIDNYIENKTPVIITIYKNFIGFFVLLSDCVFLFIQSLQIPRATHNKPIAKIIGEILFLAMDLTNINKIIINAQNHHF